MSEGNRIKLKIVLLGESSVGKSSLVLRFVRGEFVNGSLPTVGAAFLTQTLHVEGKTMRLEIWDTAGQEKFQSLSPLYYHGSNIALLVYDICEVRTFNKAKFWVDELAKHGDKNMVICLVGNKCDLEEERAVSREEADAYARSNGFVFFETSARTGANVQELFVAGCVKASEKVKDTRQRPGRGDTGATVTLGEEGYQRKAESERRSTRSSCAGSSCV